MDQELKAELQKNITNQLVSQFKYKDGRVFSFFTFMLPLNLRGGQKEFPLLVQKLIRANKFGLYIYAFELGEEKKGLHVHLASSIDYKTTFQSIKKSWNKILENHFKVQLPKESLIASSDYKEVDHTWEKVINYCCKQMCSETQITALVSLFSPENHRLYGGSRIFSDIFNKYRKALRGKKEVSSTDVQEEDRKIKKVSEKAGPEPETKGQPAIEKKKNLLVLPTVRPQVQDAFNKEDIQSIFDRVKKEYLLDHPGVDPNLIADQFLYELHSYTDVLYTFDIKAFSAFVTSSNSKYGQFYAVFYTFLQESFNKKEVLNGCRSLLNDFFIKQKHSKANVVNDVLIEFFHWDQKALFVTATDATLLYYLVNLVYILHKVQYVQKLSALHKLAHFVLKKVQISLSPDAFSTENLTRLGHVLYSCFAKVVSLYLQDVFCLQETLASDLREKVEAEDSDVESEYSEHTENNLLSDPLNSSNRVLLSFSEQALSRMKKKFQSQKDNKLDLLSVARPMIIPPKKWKKIDVCFERNGRSFYNASKNYTGGLLLNNIMIHRPLCKTQERFTRHALAVSSEVIDYVNKMQQQELVLDRELVDFYTKSRDWLPGFLTSESLKALTLRFSKVRAQLHQLYKDKVSLQKNKNASFEMLDSSIATLNVEKTRLIAVLEENRVLSRLLCVLQEMLTFPKFYYCYEFDFRMRLYCNPFAVSFMGSKFVRSVIRFKQKKPFSRYDFELYTALQYSACRELSEIQIYEFFNLQVISVLDSLSEKHKLIKVLKEAKEPFLFLSCFFEWRRYLNSDKTCSYESDFPIYLDCSANGPQIIALLFTLDKFGKFLNLRAQTKADVRGDFYSIVLYRFFTENKDFSYLKKVDEIVLKSFIIQYLRSGLKVVIMTQFYGISYQKFNQHIKSFFIEKKKELTTLLTFDDTTFFNCIKEFVSCFWKFLHGLELFQLETLLQHFQKLSHGDTNLVNWSVFDINRISMFYEKVKKKQLDVRFLENRVQYVTYNSTQEASSKQRSAFMANFVHSLDAYVLYRVCSELDFDILPIHDSFGVHSTNVGAIKQKMKEVFSFFVKDKAAARFFLQQLSSSIEEAADSSVKGEFLAFVSKSIEFGSLCEQDVLDSFYYIYYS